MDGGRRYEWEQVMFVAPHNAEVELRSARAAEPFTTYVKGLLQVDPKKLPGKAKLTTNAAK